MRVLKDSPITLRERAMTSEQPHSSLISAELDPDFGEHGLTHLQSPDPNYPNYVTFVIGTGPDNMTYIAGQANGMNRSLYTLTRLDENGLIDTSFGKQGYFYDWFYGSDRSHFYAEQMVFAHGKILLTGHLFHDGIDGLRKDKAVVCILPDGRIDKGFGDEGKFIFHVPNESKDLLLQTTTYNEECLKIAESRHVDSRQPSKLTTFTPEAFLITDDHILLLHDSGTFSAVDSFIIRLTLDGVLDKTFNEVGFVRVSHDIYPFMELNSLIIDDAGNYISGGHVKISNFDPPDAIVLVKHTNDGRLDTAYQRGGFLLIPPEEPSYYFLLSKTVKQPNNRTLCIGLKADRNSETLSGFLISLEADGFRNIQFNSGRTVFTTIDSSSTQWINADFLPDGSFLTTGLLDIETHRERHYAVARFFYNGAHDKDYANGAGWLNFRAAINFTFEASVITDKKIVFSVENDDGDKINRAAARGLLP